MRKKRYWLFTPLLPVMLGAGLLIPAMTAGVQVPNSSNFAVQQSLVPESYAVPTQIPVLVYHGIGQPSSTPGSDDYEQVTKANFTSQMSYLSQHGYATISPDQYASWLDGQRVLLPAKPVLITFDDGQATAQKATPILESHGFRAAMFVVSGFADGSYGSYYAGWSALESMYQDGWYIQLHAGACGHSFLPYGPASCLTGLDPTQIDASHYEYYIWKFGQTDSAYQARVTTDINAGVLAIQQHLGLPASWTSTAFAPPYGSWGNGENPWLATYWSGMFKAIFVQFISAADQSVAATYHVRYRQEFSYGAESLTYFTRHLSNPAFTKAGAPAGTSSGAPANND